MTPLPRTDAEQALAEQAGDLVDFVARQRHQAASPPQLQAGGPADRTGDDDLGADPEARREIVQCEKDRAYSISNEALIRPQETDSTALSPGSVEPAGSSSPSRKPSARW